MHTKTHRRPTLICSALGLDSINAKDNSVEVLRIIIRAHDGTPSILAILWGCLIAVYASHADRFCEFGFDIRGCGSFARCGSFAIWQIFAVDGKGNLETKGSVRSSLGFGMQDGAREGDTCIV